MQDLESALRQGTPTAPSTEATKIAETSFQDNLLSYVIFLTQDKFKPNKDADKTFYYGVVTNIITSKTENYDIRDIMRSPIDSAERVNLNTTKDNSERRVFFVHIPALHSILFNSEIPLNKNKDILTSEDLYKFRVETSSDKIGTIEIGNIVKVRFENNSNFRNGNIEEIVSGNILDLKLPPKETQEAQQKFEDFSACIKEPMKQDSGQGRKLATKILTLKDLSYVGLYEFLDDFINGASLNIELKTSDSFLTKYTFSVSKETFDEILKFSSENANFNKVGLSQDESQKYFLKKDDTIEKHNYIQLQIFPQTAGSVEKIIEYYQLILSRTYNLQVSIDGNILKITFSPLEEEPTPVEFYAYSSSRYETIKEFGIIPLNVASSQEGVQNASPQSPSNNPACGNNSITIDTYINTSTSDNWKRSSKDQDLINFFFKKNSDIGSSDPAIQSLKKYNILNSFNAINLDSYPTEEILKNSVENFYIVSNDLLETNGLSGNGESITIAKLKNNLSILRQDMKALKRFMTINEGVTDKNILILPIKWFSPRPVQIQPNSDLNSQLWYGRAVQLVVYIKLNDILYQMPPEILYLYIEKVLTKKHQNIGLGLFTDRESYVQYEFLDGISLTSDEPRRWTRDSGKDDLEKELNKVSPSDFTSTIKSYVQTKYLSQIFGLAPKIRNLI